VGLSFLIVCLSLLFSCSQDNSVKTISRIDAIKIVNDYPSTSKNIKKIELSWNNKTKNEPLQDLLINSYGATNDYEGNRIITNQNDILLLMSKDDIKCNLHKDNFNSYFSNTYTFELIANSKIKAIDKVASYFKDNYYQYDTNGYITSLVINEKNIDVDLDYIINETFYY